MKPAQKIIQAGNDHEMERQTHGHRKGDQAQTDASLTVGGRIREIRMQSSLSQAELAKRTGCASDRISRIENSHIIPSIETLEKLARALQVPIYRFFHDRPLSAEALELAQLRVPPHEEGSNASSSQLDPFTPLLGRMKDRQRKLLLLVASWLARKNKA